MRLAAVLSTIMLAASAGWAHAQAVGPVADVHITIGPELMAKADDYGEREFDYLSRDLKNSVEARLGRAGLMDPAGGVLELTIADAKPNRPTSEQLGRRPGLSVQSLSIGGADVVGEYIAPDGVSTPVGYSWFEDNIDDVWAATTWSDAGRAFDRFADNLATGDLYAGR